MVTIDYWLRKRHWTSFNLVNATHIGRNKTILKWHILLLLLATICLFWRSSTLTLNLYIIKTYNSSRVESNEIRIHDLRVLNYWFAFKRPDNFHLIWKCLKLDSFCFKRLIFRLIILNGWFNSKLERNEFVYFVIYVRHIYVSTHWR